MNSLIIGLGSMGKRRLRLLQKHYPDFLLAGVDPQESRKQSIIDAGIQYYTDLSLAINNFNPQIAFVCTPPLTHTSITEICLSNNIHVFSEINVVSNGYSKILNLASQNSLKLFLSSTFLYRKEINYIHEVLDLGSRSLYTLHIGQYLPDWHPWESHKNSFLSDKRTNGIREILAINLPWICEIFGPIHSISVAKNNFTSLSIDYFDSFIITIQHINGSIGSFTADLVAREPIFSLRIERENLLLKWGGRPDSLYMYSIDKKEWHPIRLYNTIDKLSDYADNIIEDAYHAEIEDFLNIIKYNTEPKWSFEKDFEIIDWINKIEL